MASVSVMAQTEELDTLGVDSVDVALPWPQNIQYRLDSLMQSKLLETSMVGMIVYDLTADSILYKVNERQALRPASTMKLVTAITALDRLGGSYQFRTQLYHTGSIEENTLKGDLYCVGGFDPAFNGDDLRAFGTHIELFDGVREWFAMVNAYGRTHGVRVEHYINSSGLKEIIEGSPIASEFKHIFAGSFIYNQDGDAEWPGIAVDYTAKTQFLFKISKGIFSSRDNKRVNASIADDKKRIPFSHMIYFGDGETDVPCMKIVGMFGGNSIAVYNPESDKKRACAMKLKRQGRVAFATPASYTADSLTFKVVCAIIDKIRADSELERLAKQ